LPDETKNFAGEFSPSVVKSRPTQQLPPPSPLDVSKNMNLAVQPEFCIDDPLDLEKIRTSGLSDEQVEHHHLDTVTETSV
jgi:hypothetical protein